MLAESQHPRNEHPWRLLREEEKILFTHLLRSHDNFHYYKMAINSCKVRDMLDGGMGSVEFFYREKKRLGGTLAEFQYTDIDDILVVITIYYDCDGNLYEIDFWKVDFSPLIRYPSPELIESYRPIIINFEK